MSDPYAPPEAATIGPSSDRAEHLRAEGLVKMAGGTLVAMGLLSGLAGVGLTGEVPEMIIEGFDDAGERLLHAALGVVVGILGIFVLATGARLRKLDPTVLRRAWLATGLCALAVPVGTLAALACAAVLASAGGRRVLQPDYAAVVEATPELESSGTAGCMLLVGVVLVASIGGSYLAFRL